MDRNTAIGIKIKKLRISKQLTIKQLSDESGLSTGFLSQLERGMSTIAIDSLAKIASILGTDLSAFIENTSKTNESVVRSYNQQYSHLNSVTIQHMLSNDVESFSFLPRLIEIFPCSDEGEQRIGHDHEGEEFIYLLEGALEIHIDGLQQTLFPGDSLQIKSNINHTWENKTNKTVKLLSINFPNPFKKQ